MTLRSLLSSLLLMSTIALSGCQSSEEKAEGFYQSGLEYLAAGDEARALIELRNVFKYDGFHKEARKTFADILMRQGKVQEAYSQYLRLIEQYPDLADVRQTLAEVSIGQSNWDEAQRHGDAAFKLAPEKPEVQAIKLALDYRAAVLARDETTRDKIAAEATTLLESLSDSKIARRIVIDRLISSPNPQAALPVIEAGLAISPDAIELHMLKLRLLNEAQDSAGVGAHLKRMYEQFPENDEVKTSLISWYLAEKDIDGAEAFLRRLAGDPKGPVAGHLAVIQLLELARGADAARAELDTLITTNSGLPNADLYGAMRASLDFSAGKQTEAITAIETILKTAEPSDQTRDIKIILARMLANTGNKVGARALVEEILTEDTSQVDALKMRAAWLIEDDKPGDAIVSLRSALDQNPQDAEILTLMAAAHERDGSLDLAGERLAMAVDVSGSGAAESLRYAQFILRQGRNQAAVAILNDARKVNPTNPEILATLAEFYLKDEDWPLAEEAINALDALKVPGTEQQVRSLKAALLTGRSGLEETLGFLEQEIAKGENDASAQMMIVQTQIRAGKTAEARSYLDDALAKDPKSFNLRLLSAIVDGSLSKFDAAEAQYRALIAEQPAVELPSRLLYGLLVFSGKPTEATAVLDAAIVAQPDSDTLKWIKAGELEKAGDVPGAIAIYEALYAKNSSNMVVANNLASLITSNSSDIESLERASVIARRLRGSDVPAFQDTYGWIEFRRGNFEDALAHLEPAAKNLPEDAMVQYHLGMAYSSAGRVQDALRQLEMAQSMGASLPTSTLESLKTELQKLKAAPTGQDG